MVRFSVEYSGGPKHVVSINNPASLSGWGTLVGMIKWVMGAITKGSGYQWDPGASTRYEFSSEGDNGLWAAVVTPPSSRPLKIAVQDLSFLENKGAE